MAATHLHRAKRPVSLAGRPTVANNPSILISRQRPGLHRLPRGDVLHDCRSMASAARATLTSRPRASACAASRGPGSFAGMARIYISSTYEDLKDCREAAYRALRRLRHDVVAMEDYVAADERPLDRCLEDVANCDVYIGLIGWRYGFVPAEDNPTSAPSLSSSIAKPKN